MLDFGRSAGEAGGESHAAGTELAMAGLEDLDLRPSLELVRLINAEDAGVPAAVGAVAEPLAALADAVAGRMADGGRLVYLGAGAAGGVAALDAYECAPTFGAGPGEVVAVVAGQGAVDPSSGLRASGGGAEDDADAAARHLAALELGERDSVVGLSASGRTPYVLAGVSFAGGRGALTAGVCCNRGSPLSASVEHALEVLTGPEVVAGSTRMKAASAQKLVLHTLSTVVMLRLGRVFGPYMVSMRVENEKLRRRCLSMVAAATGETEPRCAASLQACGGDARRAILSLVSGVGPAEAAALLAESSGNLRQALARAAAHPFTAPAASPETTLRWTSRKSSTTGKV